MKTETMLLLIAVALTGKAVSQVRWFNATSPGNRGGVAMAFYPPGNYTLLFGGVVCCNSDSADTWVSGEGGWIQLAPISSPPPRSGAAMAYDATTKTIVLFGGESNGVGQNDTWIWDGVTWTNVSPTTSPSPRRWDTQGMAYHAATGNVVLFSGIDQSGTAQGGTFGDTWIWNGTNRTWTQVFPAVSPTARRAPLALDGATGNVVLFGGQGGANYSGPLLNDTWSWNGTNWRQHSPANFPTARNLASMAYDGQLKRLVLFGGAGSTCAAFSDAWTWDGTNWTQLSLSSGPPGRYAFGMSYDNREQAVVVFGGLDNCDSTFLGDTWLLSNDTSN